MFVRPACLAIATSPHTVDPTFTEKAAHDDSDRLRATIQEMIDRVDETRGYDAVLIGMGLCGNGIVGIEARSVPLVVPRAHDCCTLFLGSKDKFIAAFGDKLSAEWSSAGYMERGDGYLRESEVAKSLGLRDDYEELVRRHGEENARYIWETIHPPSRRSEIIFISDPDLDDEAFRAEARAEADRVGLDFRVLRGDQRLIRKLIHGEWSEDEFLRVPPGGRIRGVYDHDEIIALDSSTS